MKIPTALLFVTMAMSAAEPTNVAVRAINGAGIDLLRQSAQPDANSLLSPYSIQSALAMTYAGAEGETRAEMAKVLHYPSAENDLHRSFAELRLALQEIMKRSLEDIERNKKWAPPGDPVTLLTANRLFGQTGYEFRDPFLARLKENYAAPLEALDFARDSQAATKRINAWVEEQTRQRIRDLIPPNALGSLTSLVLVNAVYFKAPWYQPFSESATKPQPFHIPGREAINVPMMKKTSHFGYAKRDGFQVVAIPYASRDLQFLILLPDDVNGLADLEKKLTVSLLSDCAEVGSENVVLSMPKFKLEPPMMPLGRELQKLGMKQAFDNPAGSANFDRMAPRRPENYLYISEVYHKTFLDLDEKGTEAAAATAVAMAVGSAAPIPSKLTEVVVDRPFLFAIQHRPTGACLFLGHLADPR